MSSPPNFNAIEGFHGEWGPPDPFIPETRLWVPHHCDTSFFGGRVRAPDRWPCPAPFPCEDGHGRLFEPGFTDQVSTHPMRGKDLAGTTESIAAEGFGTPWMEREPFNTSRPAEYVLSDVPTAGDEVTLDFRVVGDFFGLTANAEVLIGGMYITTIFNLAGAVNGYNSAVITVTAPLWNALVSNGNIVVRVEPSHLVTWVDSYCKVRIGYPGGYDVIQSFANTEVCFHHVGYGPRVRGDGFTEPTTLIQPNRFESPVASVGAYWACKPDHPAGLGEPGFTVAALPTELPRVVESTFQSHPVYCGVPV